MGTIAIDFDNVIHDRNNPVEGKRMGPPFPDAKDSLARIVEAGHHVMIHSCNNSKVIRDWLEYYGIPFHSIWGESPLDKGHKPKADFYIDDRAIHHVNWEQTIAQLSERGLKL